MKKSAWFDTPARLLIATSVLILAGEFLIMLLIENLPDTLLANVLPGNLAFELFDPVLLTLLVAPALYVLIFGPMRRQQAELDAARKTIEQSHQEWMEALDVLDDPIFLYDGEFRILRCNKAYQQRAGMPFKQIIGRPYYEIFPRSSAPDCLRTRALLEDKGEEEVTVGEATYRSRVFFIRDEQQACLYSVHTLTDITERRRMEEELRAGKQKFMQLFMEVPVSLGVASNDGVIAYFNRKFTEVFGYTVDEVPTLDTWWQKAYPDETYRSWVLDSWNAAVAKAVKEGTDVESDEYRVTCKNGAKRIVIIGGRPFEGGVLAIFNDITERKETELQLTRQIEELRAWHDVTLGRELRILELKREVDELLGEAGRPPRYPGTKDGLKEN